jgi:hypothetical protein
MVLLAELMPRFDVVVEQASVIDDAGDEVDLMRDRSGQHEVSGPRLQRV